MRFHHTIQSFVGVLIVALCLSAGQTVWAAIDLRCDYMSNPLGIDSLHPELSWKLDNVSTNVKQRAYHVLVASGREKLNANEGDLWDSGRKLSDDETRIIYEGRDLASGMTCFWKVKVDTGENAASSWSEPAFWTMGILSSKDWKSVWIGFDEARRKYEEQPRDENALFLPPVRYLRRDFTIRGPIKRAILYATALGRYEMHLNGERVGNDYFTPGWTDYDKRLYYNTYDVTAMLNEGENTIGALLTAGWFSGYVGPKKRRDHYGKDLRLRAQMVVEYEDGRMETLGTDQTWSAGTGPIIEADLLMGETYDARLEIPGWDRTGFDATSWREVDVDAEIGTPIHKYAPGMRIQAYPTETVQVFQELTPRSIAEPVEGTFVFDMGSNFSGFVRLRAEAERGTKIVLKFGERLNPDGTLFTFNLGDARATDTYICKGDGVEVWQPRFTYHGFQYVSVTGYPGTPEKDAIQGVELTSSTPVAGRFECSNPMLNQLYKNITQTQRANFIDIPTGCSQRDERLGWTGDAQIFIRAACFNSDIQTFFRKWLVDLEDAQFLNGDMAKIAPSRPSGGAGGAAWSDAYIICPWVLYEVYGDQTVLERHYDSMVRFMNFRTKKSGKVRSYGDWLNIDAPTSKELINVAYLAGNSQILSKIAAVLGKRKDVRRYEELYDEFKETFNREFVDKRNGEIEGDTQTAYVLALQFDLLKGITRKKAERRLIQKIKERDGHLSTGFLGTRDLMSVLTEIGRPDIAYRLLLNDTFPSWLFPVKNGATSMWENWDGWTPENGFFETKWNSFSHHTYGVVGQWMFENIGGIQSEAPGFKKIVIRPVMTDELDWAKTSYDSIHGRISVEWKRTGDKITIDVEIPPNTTATIHVPGRSNPVKVGSGNYTFEAEEAVH